MQAVANDNARAPYVPVNPAGPVLLHRNACVQLRSRYADCGHCESICPSAALKIEGSTISLGAGCLGCGRCMAACPTGALQVRGFAAPEVASGKRAAVTIDCFCAPKGAEIRLPCLGGLSVGALLALRLAAGEREIELLDRGWCGGCAAGKGAKEHPAAKSLGRAQARLRDAGVPERLLPHLKDSPLRISIKASVKPAALNTSRRSLMTGFGRALQAPVEKARFVPAPAPERERVLSRLAKLAARHGGRISEKLFHAVEIDPQACQAHGICAAGCPTGALLGEGGEGASRLLSHSSALCIGCGHCERVCPEKAVRLVFGGGNARAGRQVIARSESGVCGACGASLSISNARRGSRTVCERCAKSSALARSAFQQLYGSKPAAGGL